LRRLADLVAADVVVDRARSRTAYVEFYRDVLGGARRALFVHWLGRCSMRACAAISSRAAASKCDGARPGQGARRQVVAPTANSSCACGRELLARDQIVLPATTSTFRVDRRRAEQQGPARWTEIGGRRVALGVSATRCSACSTVRGAGELGARPTRARLRVARARTARAHGERLGRAVFEPPTQHYKAGSR